MAGTGQDGWVTTIEPAGTAATDAAQAALADALGEVADLCAELIRIESVNTGDGTGPCEAEAAAYVEDRLVECGLRPERISCGGARRDAVVVRIPGSNPGRDALLLHGHLDVVPARAEDWSVPPFAAELGDDRGVPMLWGRGAIDMKDMDSMILALVRAWTRHGVRPDRDVVVTFLPDEEAGGRYGSHWLAENRPDLFEGVSEAVGEVGGFSLTVREDLRLYLIQTAEKGIGWLRLVADGRAGHGSMPGGVNAVTELAEAVARIGRHRSPERLTPTVRAFLDELVDAYGLPLDTSDPVGLIDRLGAMGRMLAPTLTNTVSPTMLSAGYKVNVIPGQAEAYLDARFLPGYEEELFDTIDGLLGPHVRREFVNHDIAVETGFDGPTVEAMAAALQAEDPGARTVPFMMPAGTDAKAFSTLGIRCYGFAPLRLPPTLDFPALFHGVDERVPLDALAFGTTVLDRFVRSC